MIINSFLKKSSLSALVVAALFAAATAFKPDPSVLPGPIMNADDVFLSPDGRPIIATESEHQMVSIVDIATREITFEQQGVLSQ